MEPLHPLHPQPNPRLPFGRAQRQRVDRLDHREEAQVAVEHRRLAGAAEDEDDDKGGWLPSIWQFLVGLLSFWVYVQIVRWIWWEVCMNVWC